jgi:hypothetical protein
VKLHTYRDNGLAAEQRRDPSETSWEKVPAKLVFTNDKPDDPDRIAAKVYGAIKEMLSELPNQGKTR